MIEDMTLQIRDGLKMLLDGQLADEHKLSSSALDQQALPVLFDMGASAPSESMASC